MNDVDNMNNMHNMDNMDIMPEKDIEGSPSPISLNGMETIISQMKNGICRIYNNGGKKGSGFFCKIPFPDQDHLLPVLITNNHVLGNDDIKKDSNIEVSINDNSIVKNIRINNKRNIYTDKKLDVTIIEIIPKEDKINYFLEIDNIINNNENINNMFKKKSIYILHYPRNSNIVASFGLLQNINGNDINHKCSTDHGSSGSPIFSLNNSKIIGLHLGSFMKSDKYINKGIYIKKPIIDFYNDYKNKILNRINELSIEYKLNINSSFDIKIFDENFVKKNKENFIMIIKGKEKELCSKINIKEFIENEVIEAKLVIKLREIKKTSDFSKMFSYCSNLYALKNDSFFNTSNITNMSNMFVGCENLSNVSIISNCDTSNVSNMSNIFCKCKSLLSLPDISKWNTINVTDMGSMFTECSELKNLPDISNWNTSKVNNMRNIFYKCTSIKSLPNISKWDISNVKDINNMFGECSSLELLPDISKWNTSNITDIGNLFYKCTKLKKLPDLSKWNTSNIVNINNIFSECNALTCLPEISKWDTSNITEMRCVFNGCKSLLSLPDISKWNTSKVLDMNRMFNNCSSLTNIPNILVWNISKVKNKKSMFNGCDSLITKKELIKKFEK